MKYSHTAAPGQSCIKQERAAEAVTKNVGFLLRYANVNDCKHGASKEEREGGGNQLLLTLSLPSWTFTLYCNYT